MDVEAARLIAAALCMGIGSIAPALGEGRIAAQTMESIGRNPSVQSSLFPNMVVAMAITESTGIYALVISLIILFVA